MEQQWAIRKQYIADLTARLMATSRTSTRLPAVASRCGARRRSSSRLGIFAWTAEVRFPNGSEVLSGSPRLEMMCGRVVSDPDRQTCFAKASPSRTRGWSERATALGPAYNATVEDFEDIALLNILTTAEA